MTTSRRLAWLPVLVLVLTLGQLAVAEWVPGIDRFAGKAFGSRLIAYPALMLLVPLLWWLTVGRRGHEAPPYAAFSLIMLPFLVDVTGNSFDLYDSITWWDDANHFVNWFLLLTGIGLVAFRGVRPRWAVVATIAGLGALLAICWELGEYETFIRNGTELKGAYRDTLGDEALGSLGALLAGLLVLGVTRDRGPGPSDEPYAGAPEARTGRPAPRAEGIRVDQSALIDSLVRASAAAPDDVPLRLHLSDLLIAAGRGDEAVGHLAAALQHDPASARARELMTKAIGGPPAPAPSPAAEAPPAAPERSASPDRPAGFDWDRAEDDLGDVVPPMFAESSAATSEVPAYDIESAGLTLADVGGMTEVKKRLNAAFLAPMRNEKLRTMYKKSLRGGLLLYGPPGCGKTFIARALAGELGAAFMAVSLADILDMYVGNSEKNVHELFQTARASAPCVLFLDEVDAIGHKRSRTSSDTLRSTVNQLLLELDDVASSNEGVFVLAATNHPWDVDSAMRRPGRLDRTLLVLPPDQEARLAIWQMHLRERPVAGIDVGRLAKLTEGYSGADIAHLCDSAAEFALMDAAETGELRMIGQADIEAALSELRPSVGAWFETARNVALFANQDGTYDELATYLRKHRKL